MENKNLNFLETVCASTPDNRHFLIIKAQNSETGEIVWGIGDDQVCAITSADCIRNKNIKYNDVLIQEFPYQDNTPDSVGNWRTLVEMIIRQTIHSYIKHDGLVHVYPQWLPRDMHLSMGWELFDELSSHCDHIILYKNNSMEFVEKGVSHA